MTDFQRICMDLKQFYRMTHVAKIIKCDKWIPGRIYRGELIQPKFDIGLKLLKLHYEKTGKANFIYGGEK